LSLLQEFISKILSILFKTSEEKKLFKLGMAFKMRNLRMERNPLIILKMRLYSRKKLMIRMKKEMEKSYQQLSFYYSWFIQPSPDPALLHFHAKRLMVKIDYTMILKLYVTLKITKK
jgi:hypothetical protein